MNYKILLIILAISYLGSHAAKGQNLRQLSGIVTDTLGKGVEHATVWIQAMSDSSSHKTFTTRTGNTYSESYRKKSTRITSTTTTIKA